MQATSNQVFWPAGWIHMRAKQMRMGNGKTTLIHSCRNEGEDEQGYSGLETLVLITILFVAWPELLSADCCGF